MEVIVVIFIALSGCLCFPSISKVDGFDMPAYRICKPGPKLDQPGKMGKRCLVIGDSISIGYTPWVKQGLEAICEVLHAPWDIRDGGALDSKYGLNCLPLFLMSAMLEPINYDVIIFNFGMHDVDYSGHYPEEYVTTADYSINLGLIKRRLLETRAKVGFVLTTPAPWNSTINARVKLYNNLAVEAMRHEPAVEVADLYTWVVQVCGEPPYNSCSIAEMQPSPHYTTGGYKYLAILVSAFVRNLLEGTNGVYDVTNEIMSPIVGKMSQINEVSIHPQDSLCKNETGEVMSVCPNSATCVEQMYSESHYGCCLMANAVSCGDGKHCCPAEYTCDPNCNPNTCQCFSA